MIRPRFDWRAALRAPTRRPIAWAADRPERMLLVSNESGRYLVYAWDRTTGEQQPLPAEAKAGYTWLTPDGEAVIYLRDRDDSEVGTLMRVPWEGGEPKEVDADLAPM